LRVRRAGSGAATGNQPRVRPRDGGGAGGVGAPQANWTPCPERGTAQGAGCVRAFERHGDAKGRAAAARAGSGKITEEDRQVPLREAARTARARATPCQAGPRRVARRGTERMGQARQRTRDGRRARVTEMPRGRRGGLGPTRSQKGCKVLEQAAPQSRNGRPDGSGRPSGETAGRGQQVRQAARGRRLRGVTGVRKQGARKRLTEDQGNRPVVRVRISQAGRDAARGRRPGLPCLSEGAGGRKRRR